MTTKSNPQALQLLSRRVGVGAGFPEGLGALGPIGNASNILPGQYKSTGDAVNIRSSPSFSGSIIGSLNTGDPVKATGEVVGDESPGTAVNPKGEFVNFARISEPKSGWVAVQYLAPLDYQQTTFTLDPYELGQKAGRGITSPTPAPGGASSSSSSASIFGSGKDLTLPILIGAGVLAAGIVTVAVVKGGKMGGKKKSGAKKRRGNVKRSFRRRR